MASSSEIFAQQFERIQKLKALCLSQSGAAFLESKGILKSLADGLKEEGIVLLTQNNIKLLPMKSPASLFTPTKAISPATPIIVIDIQPFLTMSVQERLVVILHEIGHVLSPDGDTLTREIAADQFVFESGYGKALLTSLEYHLDADPSDGENEINEKRIEHLRIQLAQ